MSKSISLARSKLNNVKTLMRRGQVLSAIMCLYEGIGVYLKTKLLKHEKLDFHNRIKDAISYITSDKNFIQQYPLQFSYTPGKEKELYSDLKKIIDTFQDTIAEDAKKEIKILQAKREKVKDGEKFVQKGEYNKADEIFKELLKEFPDDSELRVEISDIYLRNGKIDFSLNYLKDALNIDKGVYLLNKVGILLRKVKKYDLSERIFVNAINKSPDDEILYFNLGRVYIDLKKWSKVIDVAEKALSINSSFQEAKKMLVYAQKQKERDE